MDIIVSFICLDLLNEFSLAFDSNVLNESCFQDVCKDVISKIFRHWEKVSASEGSEVRIDMGETSFKHERCIHCHEKVWEMTRKEWFLKFSEFKDVINRGILILKYCMNLFLSCWFDNIVKHSVSMSKMINNFSFNFFLKSAFKKHPYISLT